jgi:hypothetical protein
MPASMSREEREAEQRSLDVVQRALLSVAAWIVFGSIAIVLAAYLAVRGESDLGYSRTVGLWVMTGVIGLITAVVTLVVNRRRPWSPLALLGLLPMAVSAYWIL